MDGDLASLPDDLLDVRQDLSQYSYDPADTPDLGDEQTWQDSQFVSSQQSSQASYKLGDALPFGDAGFEVEYADFFDFNDQTATNEVGVTLDHNIEVLQYTVAQSMGRTETCVADAKSEPEVECSPDFNFFGSNTAIDVKTEPAEVSSPSAVSLSHSTVSYSPDSTSKLFVLSEDADENTSSISDKDLVTLSTRELNRRIRQLPSDQQRMLKNRRRTLKNRGYAQTCRTRRVGLKNELESENERLSAEVEQLAVDNNLLTAECDRLRKERDESHRFGEVEELRANNQVLAAECDRLRQELNQSIAERDYHKSRVDILLNVFTANGIIVEEL